jgi:transcriptional regulator with XRE-family HTH domain
MEQEMIQRLKLILDYFKLSPSKLADELSINRSRLSHILNGRNNPTLEVIQGVLNRYNAVNPDWLLFGKGEMIRKDVETDPRDLFQFAELNKKTRQQKVNIAVKEEADIPTVEPDQADEMPKPAKESTKNEVKGKSTIKRITVYFNNNEYQDFISE